MTLKRCHLDVIVTSRRRFKVICLLYNCQRQKYSSKTKASLVYYKQYFLFSETPPLIQRFYRNLYNPTHVVFCARPISATPIIKILCGAFLVVIVSHAHTMWSCSWYIVNKQYSVAQYQIIKFLMSAPIIIEKWILQLCEEEQKTIVLGCLSKDNNLFCHSYTELLHKSLTAMICMCWTTGHHK